MDKNIESVGITEFDLSNSQNPKPHAPIYHTSMKMPHPTNSNAKIVPKDEIMRAVLEGK